MPPTAVPNHTVATHIADFVGINERPANISMVHMLDLSSMWGLSPLRQLSPNEVDALGGCSVAGILDMLKTHEIMGAQPKLQKLLQNLGLPMPLYDVQWDEGGVQVCKLHTPLLDIHHEIAAAQVALRIPLSHCSVEENKCQDNITEKPTKAKCLYHGTPWASLPSILAHGLKASRRSHDMVGLWCRDEKEPALQWCCCPEIQYFPCVAIEALADDDKDSHDPSRVIQNNRTGGAYCVGVPVSKGSSTAEQLPAVTLEAVWVAMPRSHLHFQQVAQLQGTFARTIDWVLRESNGEARKKKRATTCCSHRGLGRTFSHVHGAPLGLVGPWWTSPPHGVGPLDAHEGGARYIEIVIGLCEVHSGGLW